LTPCQGSASVGADVKIEHGMVMPMSLVRTGKLRGEDLLGLPQRRRGRNFNDGSDVGRRRNDARKRRAKEQSADLANFCLAIGALRFETLEVIRSRLKVFGGLHS